MERRVSPPVHRRASRAAQPVASPDVSPRVRANHKTEFLQAPHQTPVAPASRRLTLTNPESLPRIRYLRLQFIPLRLNRHAEPADPLANPLQLDPREVQPQLSVRVLAMSVGSVEGLARHERHVLAKRR